MQESTLSKFVINKMTMAQYNALEKKLNELYFITDATPSIEGPIKFKDANGNDVSYNGVVEVDLRTGIYYASNSGFATKALQDNNGNQIDTTYANKDFSNLSSTGESHFQTPLVSGTNIKTINTQSVLGNGNISVQEVLTAGDNISIEDNKISATDTTYTAGDNVSINNNVISATDTKYTAGSYINITDTTISANGLQPTLVSGTSIKTINNNSVLGSGNIDTTQTTATTQDLSDNSTKIATTAFVKGNIQLVTSAPTTYVEGVLYCVPV